MVINISEEILMAKKKYTPKQRVDKINAYNQDYKKKHYRSFSFQINIDNCADVIQKLETVPNKVDYIVKLIRADIVENGIE